MKRFPFWIIPSALLIFIVGTLTWLSLAGKLPFFSEKKGEISQRIKSDSKEYSKSFNKEMDRKQDFSETEPERPSSQKNHENIEEKESKGDISSDEKYAVQSDIRQNFQNALKYFKKGAYQEAAFLFMKLWENYQLELERETKQKIQLYLAYALLFTGIQKNKEELIERSYQYFFDLYRKIPGKSQFSSKTVLGLARSARILEEYPEGIDMLLKENIIWAKENIRKHIYLELAYYFFSLNKIDQALMYFKKSDLPIANRKFYELLLEKKGTALYLLTLLEKNMIPRIIRKEMQALIQKKSIKEAKIYYNENKREEAYYILKKLLDDYPDEPISEEVAYRLAEFYAQDMQYQKGIFFLDKVLNNAYFDFDAAALFKKGVLYFKAENYNEAYKNFNLIRENFVSTKYYQPALDWIREIKNSQGKVKPQIDSEEKNRETEIQKPEKSDKKAGKELFDEDIFLKEEIPEEEIY